MAVRANAEWAAGDEAAPAAEAEDAPPPGFESAARQEHLSEAAALRGRALAGGASDIEEVRHRSRLQEYQECGAGPMRGCKGRSQLNPFLM